MGGGEAHFPPYTNESVVIGYPPSLFEELLIKENIGNLYVIKKPLFATAWQKVLTPKTLAYCQHWQLLGICM
jgi:hypothetical protein